MTETWTSLEICAGAGGQALGLEQAGFDHLGLVDIDQHCCNTLRLNRPEWNVIEDDLADFAIRKASSFKGIDLLAGGLPCPPFSIAGKQLGDQDERNLFPIAMDLVDLIKPSVVMIENVRGMLSSVFDDFRQNLKSCFKKLGYHTEWQLLNSRDFGVPQSRSRVVIVAIRKSMAQNFCWPTAIGRKPPTVGETLHDLIAESSWLGAQAWKNGANDIAPTIVGGSLKHGGPDLGPTRARRAWATLGVDGLGIADEPPVRDFVGMPRLTVSMVARIQGFPDEWEFSGRKTAAYRQVANAFPPPVARAVAQGIRSCLSSSQSVPVRKLH